MNSTHRPVYKWGDYPHTALDQRTPAEVQDFATRWLWTYNNERPNMALGGITPKQKVAMAA